MKQHEELYDEFIDNQSQITHNSNKSQVKIDTLLRSSYEVKVNITSKKVIDACVELVTVNGRPYSILNDSGFKKILNPMLSGFKNKVVLNSTSIREKKKILNIIL